MATGATEFIDSTTANVWIPEIWAKEAVVSREKNLVLAALVDHKWADVLKYGDIINYGTIGSLTAQTKAKSTNAALVFETVTETSAQISVATWEYNGIAVERIIDVQCMIDLAAQYAPKQMHALDMAVDDVLAGLIDDLTTTTVGDLGTALSYDDVLTSVQGLDDNNVPQEGRFFYTSPAQYYDWCKLDTFIRSDYASVTNGPLAKRGWLDIPAYRSTNCEGDNTSGHDNGLIQTEAFALVMQKSPTPERQFDINYLVDKIVLWQLYGTKTIRETFGVFMKGL